MSPRRHRPSPLRAAVLGLSVALGLSVPGQAFAQQPVEESFATALLRDVLAAVNHAHWTGNYTVLRDYSDRAFAAANDPTRLAALFEPLRRARLDLLRAMVAPPAFERAEIDPDGARIRLVGTVDLDPDRVGFDLTFRLDGGRWWLLAAEVATLPPASR